MTLKRVTRGERLRIPAESWNALMDVAEAHRADRFSLGMERRAARQRAGIITVRNDIGKVGDPRLDRSLGLQVSLRDEMEVRLADVVFNVGDSLLLEYGPGARWLHEVQFEDVLSEHRYRLPRCIGGERACPPDQVAGLSGYREVIDALGNRRHPGFLEAQAKVTQGFHPAVFDRKRANRRLRRLEAS